jgi:hypothetical protein
MFVDVHQHVWEVVRTAHPNRIGWGIACQHCKLILLEGLPKVEVEAVLLRLGEQARVAEDVSRGAGAGS